MKLKKIANPISGADVVFNIIAEKCVFFKDQNAEQYMVYRNSSGYQLIYLSNMSDSKVLLRQLFFTVKNKTAKNSDIANAYDMICAVVDAGAEKVPVFTRVAKCENEIFYDLYDSKNQVVKISNDGVRVICKQDIKNLFFKSDPSMDEQVMPVASRYNLLDFLSDIFNIDEDEKLLLAVYICFAFIPDVSHPILIIEGEKGSGKTTLLKWLFKVLNPVNKDVFILPRDTDGLITTLNNNYFSAFDNVGKVTDETSNILCQAATGGTLVKRKLYSDNSEISINIKRLVALNGINLEISQSDLLDRAILIGMNRIADEKRSTDTEIAQKITTSMASVLADIFATISKGLGIFTNIKLKKYPRMAEFAKYGYAFAEAMGDGLGEKFIFAYGANISIATESAIGENPVIECVKYLLDREGDWYGKPADLLIKLKACLPFVYIGTTLPVTFPKMANGLSRQLMSLQAEFAGLGISVERGRGKDRYLSIKKVQSAEESTESSLPTTASISETKTDQKTFKIIKKVG